MARTSVRGQRSGRALRWSSGSSEAGPKPPAQRRAAKLPPTCVCTNSVGAPRSAHPLQRVVRPGKEL